MSNTKDPSTKPGEANGPVKPEQKAAEQAPESAKKTNPVAEATGRESKDPYAEGKHIDNPEPNNGKGEDVDEFDRQADEDDAEESQASQDKSAKDSADQHEVDAKAATPDANLPDEDKTASDGDSQPATDER